MKEKVKSFDNKTVLIIERIRSVLFALMYISYTLQIMNNLQGNYGNPIQPLVAVVSCLIWVLYALLREKKDWSLFVANFPGILFGLTTLITSSH